MTPYVEVRTLPASSARRWLTLIAAALLVVPVGALLPGGATDAAPRALALLAIVVVAPVLGLALARPRETITVDAGEGTICRRTVGVLPDPRAHEERWPIAAARRVTLVETALHGTPAWGVEVELDGDEPLRLHAYIDRDLAQDTVDHLVLLGVPGTSRAQLRAAELRAEPPTVWL